MKKRWRERKIPPVVAATLNRSQAASGALAIQFLERGLKPGARLDFAQMGDKTIPETLPIWDSPERDNSMG